MSKTLLVHNSVKSVKPARQGCLATLAGLIWRKMAEAVKNDCAKGELIVSVKTRRPRFKAGAELNKRLELVNVEWNQNHTNEFAELELSLHLSQEECAPQTICK